MANLELVQQEMSLVWYLARSALTLPVHETGGVLAVSVCDSPLYPDFGHNLTVPMGSERPKMLSHMTRTRSRRASSIVGL